MKADLCRGYSEKQVKNRHNGNINEIGRVLGDIWGIILLISEKKNFIMLWVLIMPPTKLMEHIAFGASVSAWVRHSFCTYCNF